jgi:Tol biopolymer transport system component
VFDVDTGRRISLREQDTLLLPLEDAIFGWSPDSKQIAAPARGTSSDGLQVGMEAVVLFDLETGTPTQVPAKSARWSFGWSPDGRYLGLVGPDDLYVYEFATGAVIPVRGERTAGDTGVPYQLRNIPPVFSSDSRSVIFTDQDAGGGAGGDVRAHTIGELNDTLVVVGPANELGAVVSGDGKQLVYGRSSAVTIDGALKIASDDGRGATFPSELLVISADGGAPSIVASDVWPRADWSPDGRRLVTRSFEGELVIIDLDRPATVIRIPMHDAVGGYSWAPGGRHPPTSLVP